MKNFLLFFCLASLVTAQTNTFIETAATEVCECSKSLEIEKLDQEQLQMQYGLCILKAVNKNRELYKEVYGKDFSFQDQSYFYQLGQDIGMEMSKICPEQLIDLASNLIGEYQEYEYDYDLPEDENVQYYEGEIQKIEKDLFYIIHFTSKDSIPKKFLWIWSFNNAELLLNEVNWKGKKVRIYYSDIQGFNPQIDAYTTYYGIDLIEYDIEFDELVKPMEEQIDQIIAIPDETVGDNPNYKNENVEVQKPEIQKDKK